MANDDRLISVNALKERLSKLEASGGHKYYRKGMDDMLHHHMPYIIDEQPTVDAVEVVHGWWIMKQEPITWCEDDEEVFWECSICQCRNFGESPYCPICGAKMDGDGNG
jgi:hypothetical protein